MRVSKISMWVLWVLMAVAIGGCKSSGSGPTVITNDNIAELMVEAYCDFFMRCENELGPAFPSRQKCVDFMSFAFANDYMGDIFEAKDDDLLRVDSDKAKACLDQVAGAACDTAFDRDRYGVAEECGQGGGSGGGATTAYWNLIRDVPECEQAVAGRLNQDDCCDARGGCGPGLYCERENWNDTATCVPAGAAGESCWHRPCQDGLDCPDGDANPTCKPFFQLDEECDHAGISCDSGLFCDHSQAPDRCATADKLAGEMCECHDCAPGLYCDWNQWVCKAYKQEGDPCTSDDRCGSGLECMRGTCQSPDYLYIGDECDPDFEDLCPGGWFFSSMCENDGTGTYRCVVPDLQGDPCDPQADVGEDCLVFYDLLCDPVTSTCQPMPGPNQVCQILCANFLDYFCAYTNPADPDGICKPRVAENGDCSEGLEDDDIFSACQLHLECDSGTSTCVLPDDPDDPDDFQTCP